LRPPRIGERLAVVCFLGYIEGRTVCADEVRKGHGLATLVRFSAEVEYLKPCKLGFGMNIIKKKYMLWKSVTSEVGRIEKSTAILAWDSGARAEVGERTATFDSFRVLRYPYYTTFFSHNLM